MHLRLMGTAAGGGFPQWNCRCATCQAARSIPPRAAARTQSGAAISADGHRWFLLNASPDIRVQIESSAFLCPGGAVRGTPIAGVLLTDADLDHVLGLFTLREGSTLPVHATAPVRRALCDTLGVERILQNYCGVAWREPPEQAHPLTCEDGAAMGLNYSAFAVPGTPPRYRRPAPAITGDVVGYRFMDRSTGGVLVYLPHVAEPAPSVIEQLGRCDVLVLDGTFWDQDDMRRAGVGEATAAEMGHWPVGGIRGSLEHIALLPARYKIYTHINNTNPMLVDDSPQRRAVESAGAMVGWDGMEIVI